MTTKRWGPEFTILYPMSTNDNDLFIIKKPMYSWIWSDIMQCIIEYAMNSF